MNRPIVLLDCDGVLADFVGGYLKLLGSVTDRWFTREQITHFDIEASLGLSPAEAFAVKGAIGASRGFCEALAVQPGAVEGVHALHEVADVYIVTSPWNSCPTWTYERERWLERNFNIKPSHVIHCSAKYLVRGDVFVDDRTTTVDRWREANPQSVGVQWITPHNRLDIFDGMFSTNDWAVIRSICRQLS